MNRRPLKKNVPPIEIEGLPGQLTSKEVAWLQPEGPVFVTAR